MEIYCKLPKAQVCMKGVCVWGGGGGPAARTVRRVPMYLTGIGILPGPPPGSTHSLGAVLARTEVKYMRAAPLLTLPGARHAAHAKEIGLPGKV